MSSFGGDDVLHRSVIELALEIEQLNEGLDQASDVTERKVNEIQRSADRGGAAFESMDRRAGASLTSMVSKLAGFTLAAVTAISAATTLAERNENRLVRSMRLSGQEVEFNSEKWREFTEVITANSVRSIAQIDNLAARIQTLSSVSQEELQTATAVAIGLAGAYEHMGLSANRAADALARSIEGDFGAFERLGIDLDTAATNQEKLNRLVAIGAREFRAQAEAGSPDSQIAIQNLRGAGSNLLAGIGGAFGEGGGSVPGIIDRIASKVDDAAEAIDVLKPAIADIIETVTIVGAEVIAEVGSGMSKIIEAVVFFYEGLSEEERKRARDARDVVEESFGQRSNDRLNDIIGGLRARGDSGFEQRGGTISTVLGSARIRGTSLDEVRRFLDRLKEEAEKNNELMADGLALLRSKQGKTVTFAV